MKYQYDYAAEMVKIIESAEHQKQMEKLAFFRDGKVEPSEVEDEVKKMASKEEEDGCDCKEDCDDCDCDCHDKSEKKEASTSLEDTAGILLEISDELEEQGMPRLAAATIVLADTILKTAAEKSKSKSKSKSDSKSKSKKSDKKMTMKERMEKMRAAQKGKKKDKKSDKSDSKK